MAIVIIAVATVAQTDPPDPDGVNIARLADGKPQPFTAAGVTFNMIPLTGGIIGDALVVITSFYMGETEVTRKLYDAVMKYSGNGGSQYSDVSLSSVWVSSNTPSYPNDPVGNPSNRAQNNVSWYDAIVFCNRLSIILGKTPVYSGSGAASDLLNAAARPTSSHADWNAITQNLSANGFRLPTVTEWAFAVHGGQEIRTYASGEQYFHWRRSADDIGIFDMRYSVLEFCWDWHSLLHDYYGVNPTGPASGSERVYQGGRRGKLPPNKRESDIGFRIVSTHVDVE